MSTNDNEVLGTFYSDEEFPIQWDEGERELFWIYDDLHIPNPVSPMFFDIGGWWLTCDHMFRRFGTPFASDWIAKNINGYVYTAAVPADSSLRVEATEYQSRYVPRVPRDPSYPERIGAYMGAVLPHYALNFLDWWRERLRPEMDRNWDSIEALWNIKEEVKGDAELAQALKAETAGDILRSLRASQRGRHLIAERIEPYQQAFGYKAIWSHEFAFPTWKENPTPIIEMVRGYLETDYDYPKTINAVKEDLDKAIHELMDDVPQGEGREKLQTALDLSLRMNPLTPDHHFYIDQGTNARLRILLIAIGKKLVQARLLDDPADVMYLRYNELRLLMTNPASVDARTLVSQRRDDREQAFQTRPREWVGTATKTALAFPYNALWGFPEKFYREPSKKTGEVRGLAASPGVIEGPARNVNSLEQFDQVHEGEILVCRMTNPAWVVLFTKIVGLVTDAGGVTSHPAVVSREFGIPAVVGTSNATERIKTGDRIRLNGSTGVVEVLA